MKVQNAIVGALCAAGALIAGASTAAAAPSPTVVISQVYGGGNNSAAAFQNDYVELFNRATGDVSVNGWSVQYASATGTGNFAATALAGTIPPGGYYLVRLAGGTANGAPLPAAQATGTTNMSGTAGKVIVANTASSVACNGGSTPCSPAQLAQIVDLVGFGTGTGGANFFEGSAAAPTTSNTLADFRKDNGCTETDDNAADFASATPAPRNASSPARLCNGPTNPTGVGSAGPSSVAAGGDTLLTVAVTAGTNPVSRASPSRPTSPRSAATPRSSSTTMPPTAMSPQPTTRSATSRPSPGRPRQAARACRLRSAMRSRDPPRRRSRWRSPRTAARRARRSMMFRAAGR